MKFQKIKYMWHLFLSVFFALLAACGGGSSGNKVKLEVTVSGISEPRVVTLSGKAFDSLILTQDGNASIKTTYKQGDTYDLSVSISDGVDGENIHICQLDDYSGAVVGNYVAVNISCATAVFDSVYRHEDGYGLYTVNENEVLSLYLEDSSGSVKYLTALDSAADIVTILGDDQLFFFQNEMDSWWISNGTVSGTNQVSFDFEMLTFQNGKFFYIDASSGDYALYSFDDVNMVSQLIDETEDGSEFTRVDNLSAVDNRLIFTAMDTDSVYWVYITDINGVIKRTNHIPNFHTTIGFVDGWIYFKDCDGRYRTDGITVDDEGFINVESVIGEPMNCFFED